MEALVEPQKQLGAPNLDEQQEQDMPLEIEFLFGLFVGVLMATIFWNWILED